MIKVLIIINVLFSITLFSQTPGKDSLFIKMWSSTMSVTNVSTAQTRSSTNVGYYYKLGNSNYERVKGSNFKKIIDVFPESKKMYKKCISQSKQATAIGACAITLVGSFIAGTIVGVKNIKKNPQLGGPMLGVGVISLVGIYTLPRLSRKKAHKSLEYFEESVKVYNSLVTK